MCSLIDFHTGEDRLREVQAAKAAARRRAVRTQRENEFELTSRPRESTRLISFPHRTPAARATAWRTSWSSSERSAAARRAPRTVFASVEINQ